MSNDALELQFYNLKNDSQLSILYFLIEIGSTKRIRKGNKLSLYVKLLYESKSKRLILQVL